ncbi:AsmA family protein [Mesorhizobium sp. SP-1A]|uniref:AsmA family protein n=1 Tax=Mesorhizobium sp. SP-1A TaxID=3077840 RepID=UPI0028F700C9|nr:AsmA family protein [Mesorhizobium sp. SP-1A]
MLARLFVIVGGFVVLVLLAALVVPPFVDWTGYRADFEREASAILGRKVTVRGEAKARLLPFPSVTFTDVSVNGGPDGQPAMTVDTFSMDAELAPFLRGEVLIFDMRLERPKATIAVADDGTVDWAVRPSSPFDPGQVSIEKLSITDGQVELRHAAGGRSHRISHIDAVVSARSLEGPWRMDGSLRFDGLRSRVSVSTGKAEKNGRIALRVKADPDAYPLAFETDGTAGLENGAASYSGQFQLAGTDSRAAGPLATGGQSVEANGGKVTAGKAEPGYRLHGKFQLDHRRLAFPEFRFETGPLDNPYTADGSATVDIGATPRFSVKATGAQVQFDEAVGSGAGMTLARRVSAVEKALSSLPRPTIPGTVDVGLPAVVAGDTTIRDVRLSAEPAERGWTVNSFAATLPGRATLEANGLLGIDDGIGFKGSLLLAVGQPSGFAAWLAKDVDEAIRRLPAAGFRADVDMSDQRQSFSNLELMLGKAKFSGRLDAAEPGDARPSVVMTLDGGALDVQGLAAFASLFVSDKGDNRFADRDLDFKVKAGPVDAWGLTADTLDTALRLREGVLEIDRLSVGGLAGASISATGRIKDFPASPTGKLDASVLAVDLEPLVAMAASHYPGNAVLKGLSARAEAYPDLLQDARIDFVASAADNGDGSTGLALSAQGDAGGSAFSASLSGQGKPGELDKATLAATFNASNKDATALLALYGLPVLPLGLVGEATTGFNAKGTLAGGLATSFNFSGVDFKALFDGTVAFAPQQGPTAKGKLAIDAADMEPWLMTTGMALPGMGTGTAVNLAADADYGNGLLVVSGLEGAVNEAAVSGDINADIKDGRPHLTGALALDELDLAPVAAMVFGSQALAGDGKGWPTAPFAPASAAPFSAEVDLTASALLAAPVATADDASLTLKLDPEGLHVSNLKARLFGGQIAGLFELRNNGGTGLFSGQLTASGVDLAAMLPQAGLSGKSDLSATLSAGGKSVDGMISALSGSGTASLKGLAIDNLNPDALPAFIAKADEAGRDIDAAAVAAFAPAIAKAGRFAAPDTQVAFTVASGTLRVPPVDFASPGSTLTSDLAADFGAQTVAARGSIAYKPGDEALVGSAPVLNFSVEGPFGATQRSFDSAPLAQFLTQRALEREQQRVEAMQSALLEKQRLRREVRYYAALQAGREKAAAEIRRLEEDRARAAAAAAAEQARIDAKAKADADAATAEAARKAEDEKQARRAAEQAAADRKAREEAQKAAEQARQKVLDQAPPAPEQPTPRERSAPAAPASKPFSLGDFLKTLQ